MLVNSVTIHPGKQVRTKTSLLWLGLVELLVLFALLPAPGYTRVPSQEEPREPLGSLTSVGEVYVNDSPAPTDSTIFSGDRVRTGETGTAAFTMSGKGTIKISPRSQVVFAGSYLFTAELQEGTVVLNSLNGPNGITLRTGNFVLVPSFREQSVTSKIERAPDGSSLVTCLEGSVGVVTLEGKYGDFLHAGQSLRVSLKTQFSPVLSPARRTGELFHPRWVILGLAGTAAIVAAADMLHGGGKQAVSPSVP
jgi:hypothetical protein